MRKRIYRISEDKFDDLKPDIEFDAEQIDETCFVSDEFSGSIYLKSTNGVKIRGVVYCDSPYVQIEEPWFDKENVHIEYKVADYNFKAGEKLIGKFTIIAVGIEKQIDFTITYIKRPLMSSVGEIKTLEEYCELAQNHFTEAVSLFYTDRFSEFISDFDKRTRLLYRGFKAAPVASVNVDEFLVSTGYKPKMTFDLQEREDKYFEVNENVRGEIEITRSTWGYIDIKVSCDADFVSVEKNSITSDFFLGSIFNMNYYIHKDKMHEGLNFAKITFDYRDIHKEITILASTAREDVKLETESHNKNMYVLKACRLYEDFRLRRITTSQWCHETLEILAEIAKNEELDNFNLLTKALLHVTNNQKQEALWIIQDLKRSIEDKGSAEWAYLLYVCTLIEREEDYVDRLTENIEVIFREHPNDVRIFWFLLFLRKEYIKNPTAKLRDIAEWINRGVDSPLLYIEAYYIYVQDPYLITAFDEVTIKVLNWARKKNAISRDIAIQMIHVLDNERVFNSKVMPILESCYEIYPDLQLLLSIVSYLLRANFVEPKYFKWYKLAIEANLHVSGIFEAYMDAMPSYSVDKFPQILTMFFKYNNDLSYEKKALLYANIILHRSDDLDTYEHYEQAIEAFALEQLKLGRLDDNLAVCYQRLMELGIFDSEVARLMSELAFKKKLAVINSNVRRIFLYQEEFKAPTISNVIDHRAYINYIGSKGVIFLEDEDGYLFVDDEAFLTEDVINATEYYNTLKELTTASLPYVLTDFERAVEDDNPEQQPAVEDVKLVLESNLISLDYVRRIYPKLIQVLRDNDEDGMIIHHFMEEADLKSLSEDVIGLVLEVFISNGKYDEAYYMLKNTNASKLKLEILGKLCKYLVSKAPEQVDDFLILLSASLVSKGIYLGEIVRYLVRFYVGPTDTMLLIYKDAYERGDDVVEFAERILTQVLYRDFLCDNIMDVFDTYASRRNNKMIVEAFLTFQAHEYLSEQKQVPEEIFAHIYHRYQKGLSVNESMRIALLKYLCMQKNLEEDELDMLDALLADAILRNQYFGFFVNCNEKLRIKYHLYDKHFVEITTAKRKSVVITYSINGQPPVQEDMIEMYDGLYVKQFILFYGDELRYEIYCDELSNEPLKSQTIVMSDEPDIKNGRFALMNSISRYQMYGENGELATALKNYQGLDTVTRDLFNII